MSLHLLEYCIRSRSLILCKAIHQQLLKRSPTLNLLSALQNLFLFYASCNEVKLARNIFDQIPLHDVISWDFMIRAYAKNGPIEKALELYHNMIDKGMDPTRYTYLYVLKACSGLRAIGDGSLIHEHLRRRGLCSDVYISTALFDLYAKCGEMDKAMEVFRGMTHKDLVAWNASISGFSSHGDYDRATQLFISMQKIGGFRPNSSTIVGFLPVLGHTGTLMDVKTVQGFCTRNGFLNDVVVQTGILDVYAKCKCLVSARKMFDMIHWKNEVTWTAMIGGYVDSKMIKEAMELFLQVLLDNNASVLTAAAVGLVLRGCASLSNLNGGQCLHCYSIKSGFLTDLSVSNTLISLYAKCGIATEARKHFNEMGLKDTVSYNAIISGCADNGNADVFSLFREMKFVGIKPDFPSMLGIIKACSFLSDAKRGSCCHAYSFIHGFAMDTSVCNALIDMYLKCGLFHAAWNVFGSMQKWDIVSWNTMILGYGIYGLGGEALSLFNFMLSMDLEPDNVTFLALLSACNHSGLVYEGKQLLGTMIRDFGIVPRINHIICMTDLLGRAGFLDEAYDFVRKSAFKSSIQLWITLLSACRKHHNVALAEEVIKKIEILELEGTGSFFLLSNLYSGAQRWEDAEKIRMIQKGMGFEKSPGCSWLETSEVFCSGKS